MSPPYLKGIVPCRQRGAGLIEVMISVLVMGVGLLGIAAMQATALRNNQSALERTQATVQTYSILDAIRANAEAARAGAYTIGRTCAVPTGNATLAQRAWISWFTAMRESMGQTSGTCGTISQSGDNFSVPLDWDDSHATNDGVEGENSARKDRQSTRLNSRQ